MQITVVAVMCHALASIPQPVCHEEIIVRSNRIAVCVLASGVAEAWKRHSIYRADSWIMKDPRCVIGNYLPKDLV